MVETFDVSVKTPAGQATMTLSRKGRIFSVDDFVVAGRPELCLAFAPGGPGVENLDECSDMAQCFNLSNKVRYGTVVLGSTEMRANSREELEYALKRVKVQAFNPEEI